MRIKPPTLKGTGFLFALSAFGQVLVALAILFVLRHAALSSPDVIEVLFAILAPGLVAGVCAFVLLALPGAGRLTLVALLAVCFAACVGILLAGWGLLVIALAVPAALLAMCLHTQFQPTSSNRRP
jgi:hypothetical protein